MAANLPNQSAIYQLDENVGFYVSVNQDAVYQIDENVVIFVSTSTGGVFLRIIRRN